MVKVAPSILSGDFSRLGEDVKMIADAGADYVHIDVMDGHFVPNITFGMPVISAIRKVTDIPFDTHLMIDHADRFVNDLVKAGSDLLTVHYENHIHLHRLIYQIKEAGVKAGVSIVPSTDPTAIRYLLRDVDLVLVMSVNPGFGGQKFIPQSLLKIAELKQMREELGLSFEIEVDGGVGLSNYRDVIHAGADILVAGSAVFQHDDPAKVIRTLKGMEV